MSYILDALKRSDRARQLNTNHELSYSHLNEDRSRENLWLKIAVLVLSLMVAASIMYMLFSKNTVEEKSDLSSLQADSTNEAGRVSKGPELPATNLEQKFKPVEETVVQSVTTIENIEKNVVPETNQQPSALSASESASSQQRRSLSDFTIQPSVNSDDVSASVSSIEPERVEIIDEYPVTSDQGSQASGSPDEQITNSDFSSYDKYTSIRSQYSLPDLHLDILMHHSDVSKRKAYINMSLYREGDSTNEGAEVLEIGKEGVLLRYSSHDFVLTAQ